MVHIVYLRLEVDGGADAQDAATVIAAAVDTGALHKAVADNADVTARIERVTCEADLGKLLEWNKEKTP